MPVLHLHVPAGLGAPALKRAWKRQLGPLLRAMWEHQDFCAGLHLSGATLHSMAMYQAEGLVALEQMVDQGRIEMLAGGWSHPFLSGIPERDAISQLGLQSRLLELRTGSRPQGVYLAEGVWDPDLPRLLDRAKLAYAIVSGELLLAAGVRSSQVPGLHHTERGGRVLQVLATDPGVDRVLKRRPGLEAFSLLDQRRAMGIRNVVWVGSMATLDRQSGGFQRWLNAFLSGLHENSHWMETALPSQVTGRIKDSRGLVYLPSWVPAHIAEASSAIAEATLRSRGGWYIRAGRWEGLMVRYSESNRLHKRMLIASHHLQRLRARLKRGERPELDRLLDSAALALYRCQGSAVLWPAPGGGFYNQTLRMSAWKDLVEVEHLTQRALGESRTLRVIKSDLLCSGSEDLLVYGPKLHAAVEPAAGGVLAEFIVHGVGNLVDVPTRREEPWHEELLDHAKLPSLVEDSGQVVFDDVLSQAAEIEFEEESASLSIDDTSPLLEHLATVFAVDRERRAAFSDRFLGPTVTAQNLASGQFPEVGDFAGASYAVLSTDKSEDGRCLAISMAREGTIMVGREARLVQVRKRMSFALELPQVCVDYELVNRTSEPVEGYFATELPLAVTARAELCFEKDGERQDRCSATALINRKGVSHLTLTDAILGLRVRLEIEPPCHLVSYPVVCVVRSDEGGLKEAPQGVCLVPRWPVKLWGEERRAVSLTMTIER